MRALMTRVNRPRVSQMSGVARALRIGLTMALTRPKTSATRIDGLEGPGPFGAPAELDPVDDDRRQPERQPVDQGLDRDVLHGLHEAHRARTG
jgi:hypothetical protein